jgi:hypothetical protein
MLTKPIQKQTVAPRYYPHLRVEITEEEIPVEYVETRFSLREGK